MTCTGETWRKPQICLSYTCCDSLGSQHKLKLCTSSIYQLGFWGVDSRTENPISKSQSQKSRAHLPEKSLTQSGFSFSLSQAQMPLNLSCHFSTLLPWRSLILPRRGALSPGNSNSSAQVQSDWSIVGYVHAPEPITEAKGIQYTNWLNFSHEFCSQKIEVQGSQLAWEWLWIDRGIEFPKIDWPQKGRCCGRWAESPLRSPAEFYALFI